MKIDDDNFLRGLFALFYVELCNEISEKFQYFYEVIRHQFEENNDNNESK